MLPFSFSSYSQIVQSLNRKPVYNRESSMLFHEDSASRQTPVSDTRTTTHHDKTPAKKASASRARPTLQPMKSERETKRTHEEQRDAFFSLKIGTFSFAVGHKEKRADRSSFRQ
jgi:hypothetical protein